MAIIPNAVNPFKMPVGVVGAWANMEVSNARTAFADAVFPAAIPLMKGTSEEGALPLTAGNQFIGIALRTNTMGGTPLADGEATFAVGDLFGVADMGVVFVLAGTGVVRGGSAFYDPATRKYHGATAAGRIALTDAEFDTSAADGEPVGLRVRIVPTAA